jgi:putative colanic acid biosynthesis UDP-glucose lipid carrier transferase
VAGVPVLNVDGSPVHEGINRWVKEAEDKLLAAAILLLFSPFMLILAIGVKLSSPGPVMYRQERISWNGKPFTMLKLRSMPVDAEELSGPVWAHADGSRATRFGSFLRKSSLDELPQFINVLKGEMSIVGPRPERPFFVAQFREQIPEYMRKHLVKGGITGWAQVNGWRGDTDLRKRVECDLYYVRNWSLRFDLYIVIRTVFSVFFHKNAY